MDIELSVTLRNFEITDGPNNFLEILRDELEEAIWGAAAVKIKYVELEDVIVRVKRVVK